MRRSLYIFFLALSIGLTGCASTGKVKSFSQEKEVSQAKAEKSMKEVSDFFTRKRFTYLITWNGIPVGRIIAQADDVIRYKDDNVYVVSLRTESNKFLSKIYRVEDVYTSYIDVDTMTSRRYEADRKEGNYRKHVIVEYDFDKGQARYTNLTDGSVKYCDIKRDVQDPVSAMCYFMTLPAKIGDRIKINVNLNEKNYELYSQVESLDVIKLPSLGLFPAFRVRPKALLKGQVYEKGRGYMYFAAGDKRYPLYGVVNIPFGRVKATLKTIENF